jgi:hypothetical protein
VFQGESTVSSEKMQPLEETLLQQLKKVYPQLAEELTEVLKRHGLAEMSEVEIRLTPTKESIELDSRIEGRRRKFFQSPLVSICLALQSGGTKCI